MLIAFISCDDDEKLDKTLKCSVERIDFGSAQDAMILFIETGIDWKISSKADWVEFSVEKGKGKTGVLVGVSENTQLQRTDTLRIEAGELQLKIPITQQSASIISYTIGEQEFRMVLLESVQYKEADFYCCETEVTNALWAQVMGGLPYDTIPGYSGDRSAELPGLPASYVSWYDVSNRFLPALKNLLKADFRLPTEGEWLFAAQGGKFSKKYSYSGSNTVDEVAWYGANSMGHKVVVKKLKPNEAGLYDMSGNVSEWSSDWSFPASDQKKIIRGGNYTSTSSMFSDAVSDCLVYSKSQTSPSCYEEIVYGNGTKAIVYRCSTIGFRFVVSAHPAGN